MPDTKTVLAPPVVPAGVSIPDFEIKCRIGEGGFGEVFLALDKAIGRYRAVKVVHRSRFQSDRPYDIEFDGVQRFEEVSREHEGFVDILRVSPKDQGGCFYYVMEVADDLESQKIDPARYIPRTLSKDVERRGRLPPLECVRVALVLVAALAELHRRNLVHRDVKPSNIVFVRGAPKLADVGLVTEAGDKQPHTNPGTMDYMDPEVHGMKAGDLYSFGKVLYKMATGLDPRRWPEPPEQWPMPPDDFDKTPDLPVFRELNAIWRKACDKNRASRYQSALDIHQKLVALQAGSSYPLILQMIRRYGAILVVLLVSLAVGFYFRAQDQKQKSELRQRKVGFFVANGNHALETGDLLSALSWFADAWNQDSQREKNDFIHRVRLGSVLQNAPTLKQMWFQERKIKEAFKEAFFTGEENQVVISISGDRWQVYDLGSGSPLPYKPFGMGLPDEKVSLSSRTGTAVTSAETNRIALWDYKTGTTRGEWTGTNLLSAALSPDGNWIAAAETKSPNYEALLLWRTQNDALVAPVVLGQVTNETTCLIFSPDSRWLLSAGTDAKARIWDVESNRLVSTFVNHSAREYIFNGAFSPDGDRVVTASSDRTARIWDRKTATELARFIQDDAVFAADFRSDGKRLVTAGLDFTARIWNPDTQTSLQILRHNAKVVRATFSPMGKYLLTSCYDDVVRVWELRDPPVATLANGFLTSGGTRTILRTNGVWSLSDTSGSIIASLNVTNQLGVAFSFAPDERCFVVTFPTNSAAEPAVRAQCFDTQTGAARGKSITLPQSWSNRLIVSAGGQRVFACNTNAGAVWDTISGARIGSLSNGCNRASFSPDGKLLALGRANQVDVVDLENDFAKLPTVWHPTNSSISAIEWDAAGVRLITSCWNKYFDPLEAQVWVARSGKTNDHPLAHRDGVLYATFNHNGTRAITCGEDHLAILWDLIKGSRQAPPLVHRHQVFFAAFSEDDHLVATAAGDNAIPDTLITVWSADSGEQLTLPLALPSASRDKSFSIRFREDNRALIIRDHLGQSYFWKLPHYDGSRDELRKTAELLAAQQTDSTESLKPQTKEGLRKLWEGRAKFLPPVE